MQILINIKGIDNEGNTVYENTMTYYVSNLRDSSSILSDCESIRTGYPAIVRLILDMAV